ncbi:EboA domain-containing protein [Kribbella sp. NPDC056345]|uniref:EboA domain-containing protein n=1 Tax=Kribbella sp. NPDC056345 TaxID=3345789 RepID=UPI0035DE3448
MKAADLPVDVSGLRDQPLAEVFPAVGRIVGRELLGNGWTTDEAARAVLLAGASAAEIAEIYRYGDAAEKRAVLKALALDEVATTMSVRGVELLDDAIRTNDPRLITAALGSPYATEKLPMASFRHAVLKCVFAGIPLAEVDGLPDRVDAELLRMMSDFAAERTAAGRAVPADLTPYLTER